MRWGHRRISRPVPSAETASGRLLQEETASTIRIPIATPREASSVDCLGLARAKSLVGLGDVGEWPQ
jgi:hypothetical protein